MYQIKKTSTCSKICRVLPYLFEIPIIRRVHGQITRLKQLWTCSCLNSTILYDKNPVACSWRVRNIFFLIFFLNGISTDNDVLTNSCFLAILFSNFKNIKIWIPFWFLCKSLFWSSYVICKQSRDIFPYNNIVRFKEILLVDIYSYIIFLISFWVSRMTQDR